MSSFAATHYNSTARVRMFAVHGEVVAFLATPGEESASLTVIWKRGTPDAAGTPDGIGAQGYTGDCACVVQVADLATPPGPQAEITRHGEAWTVRKAERQDEWTWILHLAKRDAERRMPGRR